MADPKKELVAGEWYFAAACKQCGAPLVLHDPTKGNIKLDPGAKVTMTCPQGHQAEYGPGEVQARQATIVLG